MHKVLILACCVVFLSFVNSKYVDNPKTSENHRNSNGTILKAVGKDGVSNAPNKIHTSGQLKGVSSTIFGNKNGTLLKTIVEKVIPKTQVKKVTDNKSNVSDKIEHKVSKLKHHSQDKIIKTLPVLQKIQARITRSKDAVWATISLTALCILLVLAVAQSRMWKDHYYSESQGVPLPNFNERVLFKDVMERKISSLKQFFKNQKRTKEEKNETELESLLPPSEWD